MVASTNHLDELDPGLSSRPSRFDRKYLFPLPAESERTLYCSYWRSKLAKKGVKITFPKKICSAIAAITDGFSFAYLQEAFVAALLAIAGRRSEELDEFGRASDDGDDDDDLDEYELWREMKKQVNALRDDMDNGISTAPNSTVLGQHNGVQTPTEVHSPPPTALPVRAKGNETFGKHVNPRLEGRLATVDVDHLNTPLMTDRGMFMSSRFAPFNGILPLTTKIGNLC